MLDAGDPAPDFDLPRPTTSGDQTYRLSAAAQEAPVVVAFFAPADRSGTADLLDALAGVDWASVIDRVSVFGIGVGPLDDVEALATDLDTPFPLLADPNGFFAERYGVMDETPDGWRPRRALFVVDQRCRIQFAWRSDDDGAGSVPIDDLTAALGSI